MFNNADRLRFYFQQYVKNNVKMVELVRFQTLVLVSAVSLETNVKQVKT